MIVTAGVLVAVAAAALAAGVATESLTPLYGSIVAGIAALVVVTAAGIRHGRARR